MSSTKLMTIRREISYATDISSNKGVIYQQRIAHILDDSDFGSVTAEPLQ